MMMFVSSILVPFTSCPSCIQANPMLWNDLPINSKHRILKCKLIVQFNTTTL